MITDWGKNWECRDCKEKFEPFGVEMVQGEGYLCHECLKDIKDPEIIHWWR